MKQKDHRIPVIPEEGVLQILSIAVPVPRGCELLHSWGTMARLRPMCRLEQPYLALEPERPWFVSTDRYDDHRSPLRGRRAPASSTQRHERRVHLRLEHAERVGATGLAEARRPIARQSPTKRVQTLRMARPWSLRKSAMVL